MNIDLNSDLGESFGNYSIGNDEEVMKYITSANIACGYHAGDPIVIEKTIKLALKNKVAVGAHPGYQDLMGFGRRSMKMSNDELHAMVLYQVGALKAMTEALGGKLDHVKPHGALYNDLACDHQSALVFADAIYKIDPYLIIVGLANSEMLKAAKETGLKAVAEVFADRTYNDDGLLVSRRHECAVITEESKCLEQVDQLITTSTIQSINGNTIKIHADTICVHGDNSKALAFVRALRKLLSQKNVHLKSLKNL